MIEILILSVTKKEFNYETVISCWYWLDVKSVKDQKSYRYYKKHN